MIGDVLLYLIAFSFFVVLQALCINGIYECFRGEKLVDSISGRIDYQGMILYMIAPKIIEKYKRSFFSKNLYSCVKCMSSTYGALTFWPLIIYLFKWHWVEVPIFIFDVFILIYLNWFFYKRV